MENLTKFHYELVGNENSSKLVFLHGLMGSGVNWKTVVSHFQETYQVLTYDQRGHGRSVKPDFGYQPEDFADDLLGILQELGWDQVYLVGHSMGGRNALNFAHRFPEKVKALVIEDIGPNASAQAIENIRVLLESVPVPFGSRREARDFFRNEFEQIHSYNPRAKAIGQFFYTNITEMESGQADWRFSKKGIWEAAQCGRNKDRWAELEGLTMPTLVIRGEDSSDLTQDVFEDMIHCNSRIQGEIVPGSGHWVHFDQPKKFVEVLRQFLESH